MRRLFHFGGGSEGGGMEEEMGTRGYFAALHPSAMKTKFFTGSDDHASSTAGGTLVLDPSDTHNTREGWHTTSGGFHFGLGGPIPSVAASAGDEASAHVFHFCNASVGYG